MQPGLPGALHETTKPKGSKINCEASLCNCNCGGPRKRSVNEISSTLLSDAQMSKRKTFETSSNCVVVKSGSSAVYGGEQPSQGLDCHGHQAT